MGIQTIQIIKSPNGEKMVVLPLKEYQRLTKLAGNDDAIDIAEGKRQLAAIKAGRMSVFSAAVARDIAVNGIHVIAALRKDRKWSAADLAEKSGVSRAMISHIENRKRKGTANDFKKIAVALGVDVGSIIE